jgi:hypothetical protein
MLQQEPGAASVWKLLEEAYLDSVGQRSGDRYRALSEPDKRTALMDFANDRALISKRWAAIVQDLRSVGLKGCK